MKKLFKLKQWLTLEESASHLSALFEEAVTVADVLRLALDGHLTISVYLVNHAAARLGKVVPFKELPLITLPRIGRDMCESDEEITIVKGHYVLTDDVEEVTADTRFALFEKDVEHIDGVWDLSMRGAERLDLEHKFQRLTGGPAVELVNIDGTFLCRQPDTWASLQSQFEDTFVDDPDAAPQSAKDTGFAESLAKIGVSITPPGKKRIKGEHYPAGGLPKDCVWVVRTESLRSFERRVLDADSLQDAPFFDADANDYPYLLHVAVRAWKYARQTSSGTPKQRVLGFLESNYSNLPQGSRDAIAQVVNWQRTGGRPSRKTET